MNGFGVNTKVQKKLGGGNPIDAIAHLTKNSGINWRHGHHFHHFSVKIEKIGHYRK